jgi:glycerol-3-phosphate O-acyltransferase
MAVEGGIVQAVFPEGGLSRDGRLRPPRLGLLDYMVRGFDPHQERDIVFIPVGVNYDRVLEDRTLQREAQGGGQVPFVRAVRNACAFAWKNLSLAMRNDWRRFGYAAVQFGRPLSLRDWCVQHQVDFRRGDREQRFAVVARLAEVLMTRIGANVPVLSVPLIALVAGAEAERRFTAMELKAGVQARLDSLRDGAARYLIYDAASSFAVDAALDMMCLRGLLLRDDDCFHANPAERALLDYYAASIAHLFGGAASEVGAGPVVC